MATATKMENVRGFPDYLEKSETGAVGRALAFCGYGTQFAPELEESNRLADAPYPVGGGNRFGGGDGRPGNRMGAPRPGGDARPYAPRSRSNQRRPTSPTSTTRARPPRTRRRRPRGPLRSPSGPPLHRSRPGRRTRTTIPSPSPTSPRRVPRLRRPCAPLAARQPRPPTRPAIRSCRATSAPRRAAPSRSRPDRSACRRPSSDGRCARATSATRRPSPPAPRAAAAPPSRRWPTRCYRGVNRRDAEDAERRNSLILSASSASLRFVFQWT
jgi:hypothetical protein